MKYIKKFKSLRESKIELDSSEEAVKVRSDKALKKVLGAVAIINKRWPALGSLLGNLTIYESCEDSDVKTAATDGYNIIYNPVFFNKLKFQEVIFVIAHEIMHNALRHFTRRGSKDPDLYNQACDYALNQLLYNPNSAKATVGQMPTDVLYNPSYNGMTSEQIYEILKKKNPPMWCATGKCSGNGMIPGDIRKPGSLDSEKGAKVKGNGEKRSDKKRSDKELEKEWQKRFKKVLNKLAGQGSGDFSQYIHAENAPTINWESQLRDFFDDVIFKAQHTPVSRRFVHQGDYIDGTKYLSEGIGTLVISIDESGSVGKDELKAFSAEIQSIFKHEDLNEIYVIHCADTVKDKYVEHFENIADLNLDWKLTTSTNGGTSFQAPLDWVHKNLDDDISAFIFFTDGHEKMPVEPPYSDNFLWVISNDPRLTAKTTFGKRLDVTGIDF